MQAHHGFAFEVELLCIYTMSRVPQRIGLTRWAAKLLKRCRGRRFISCQDLQTYCNNDYFPLTTLSPLCKYIRRIRAYGPRQVLNCH